VYMTHDAFVLPSNPMSSSQLSIAVVCDEIKELLLEKNSKYGDSALDPVRVFSGASKLEQLFVRIDDKLSRIQRGAGLLAKDEDVINDLIGYLILLKIALREREQTPPVNFPAACSDDIISFGSGFNSYWPNDPWDGLDLDNPYDFMNLQTTRSPD
jgi:hypothetical protein